MLELLQGNRLMEAFRLVAVKLSWDAKKVLFQILLQTAQKGCSFKGMQVL